MAGSTSLSCRTRAFLRLALSASRRAAEVRERDNHANPTWPASSRSENPAKKVKMSATMATVAVGNGRENGARAAPADTPSRSERTISRVRIIYARNYAAAGACKLIGKMVVKVNLVASQASASRLAQVAPARGKTHARARAREKGKNPNPPEAEAPSHARESDPSSLLPPERTLRTLKQRVGWYSISRRGSEAPNYQSRLISDGWTNKLLAPFRGLQRTDSLRSANLLGDRINDPPALIRSACPGPISR